MAKDENIQTQFHKLHLNAKKAALMPQEDFQKIPSSEIQKLLQEMSEHADQSEKEKEALQKSLTELEDFRRQCTDLYDFAPVGYFNLDERGIVEKVNITARDMLSKSQDELINTRFISLIVPEYQEAFNVYLKEIFETGSRLSTEVEMGKADGTTFYAQLQSIAVREKANVTYRISVANISDRKLAENKLKESEAKYRMLFESMEEGYALCEMIYDEEGKPVNFRFLAVNPAFAKQTGFPVKEVMGRTVKEIIPTLEFYWAEAFDRVVQTGQSERIENYVAELGRYFEAHAWRSGNKQFSVVFDDVTERKRREIKTPMA